MRISDWSSDVCSSDLMDAVSHGKTCDEKRERARIVMKRAGRRKRGVSGPQIGGCGSDAGRRPTTVPASLSFQPCLRRSNATQIRPRNSRMIDTTYARSRPAYCFQLGFQKSDRRAAWREIVFQYVLISRVGGRLKKKKQ